MKKSTYTTSGIIAALLLIVLLPALHFDLNVVYLAFIGGNFLFVALVYNILKNGKASDKKFDEGDCYEDQLTK